jgi:hypothetical protein
VERAARQIPEYLIQYGRCDSKYTNRYKELRSHRGRRAYNRAWSPVFLRIRHQGPPSLPLVPGCSCCKSESPAGSRCLGGHVGSEEGHLGASAGKKGKEESRASWKTRTSALSPLAESKEKMAK